MRIDLETADHASSVGTFLLTIVLIELAVSPMLPRSSAVQTTEHAGSAQQSPGGSGGPDQKSPVTGWIGSSLLAASIVISGALHLAATSKTKSKVLGGPRAVVLPELSYPHEKAILIPEHRRSQSQSDYYLKAFDSGQEVFFVSVMSQHTVKNMRPLLKRAMQASTKIRVLTWDPNISGDRVESWRSHIRENDDQPERTYSQVKDAAAAWQILVSEFQGHLDLEVHTYQSTPTFQGILVGGGWAYIELVPYSTPTDERPALLLTPSANPSTFPLIWSRCTKLFNDSPRLPTLAVPTAAP